MIYAIAFVFSDHKVCSGYNLSKAKMSMLLEIFHAEKITHRCSAAMLVSYICVFASFVSIVAGWAELYSRRRDHKGERKVWTPEHQRYGSTVGWAVGSV